MRIDLPQYDAWLFFRGSLPVRPARPTAQKYGVGHVTLQTEHEAIRLSGVTAFYCSTTNHEQYPGCPHPLRRRLKHWHSDCPNNQSPYCTTL